jgi:hypothetical protein
VDKNRKINLTGDLRPRNAHVIVNADGSWSFNHNNPLEAADKYQCQIWPDDSLKSKPELFHKALVDIQKEYKAQGIDIQIPDPTNKAALDALHTVAPQPPQPNDRDGDDDDDEDGPRPRPRPPKPKPDEKPVTPPVTPPTPQVNPVAGLDSVTKVLMGEPMTITDPQTNQQKQVAYSLNPLTLTYFASAAIPKPISDTLRSGKDANTICAELRTLSQQYPTDYARELTNRVNKLTNPMLAAPYSDTRDAGILTNYFVTQLSNPEPVFIANLANAMQKHDRGQLTNADIAIFQPELRRAIANCAAVNANVYGVLADPPSGDSRPYIQERPPFNANLTVENPTDPSSSQVRYQIREQLISRPYRFDLLTK